MLPGKERRPAPAERLSATGADETPLSHEHWIGIFFMRCSRVQGEWTGRAPRTTQAQVIDLRGKLCRAKFGSVERSPELWGLATLIQPPGPAHFFPPQLVIDLQKVRAFALGAARAGARFGGMALAFGFELVTALARGNSGSKVLRPRGPASHTTSRTRPVERLR